MLLPSKTFQKTPYKQEQKTYVFAEELSFLWILFVLFCLFCFCLFIGDIQIEKKPEVKCLFHVDSWNAYILLGSFYALLAI